MGKEERCRFLVSFLMYLRSMYLAIFRRHVDGGKSDAFIISSVKELFSLQNQVHDVVM